MDRLLAYQSGVRFLVAAYDRLAAAHVKSMLAGDFPDADVTTAHSGAELEIVISQPFDLVVLDTRNIEHPGPLIEAFAPHVRRGGRLAVIVIDEQAEHLRWAVNTRQRLGIPHGIMPATMTPESCRAALVLVATGDEYLNWAMRGVLQHPPVESQAQAQTEPSSEASPAPYDLLTPREAQILQLLKQGLRNKEVADRLDISINTAKVHIASIKRKYRVSSRMQLL